MTIPYRTRRALKNIGVTLLVLLLASALIWSCWFIWLDRYLVYDRDEGAKLDFDRDPQISAGVQAVPPEQKETVPIYYNEGNDKIQTSFELTQLSGYYADTNALKDIAAVMEQIRSLEAGTAVMVDVKNGKGEFYYSSSVGSARCSSVDVEDMDELLAFLDRSGMYTIARLPALRDAEYGRNNVEHGLFHSSRGYLWVDSAGCYWLNPSSEGAFSHIVQTVVELKALGFDEVVLTDFRVPEGKDIYFPGSRSDVLTDTAAKLVQTCTDDRFAVSFVAAEFDKPEGRSRWYLENISATQIGQAVENNPVADAAIYLVFLTEVHDTRYDEYGVLRPLATAH